MDSAQKTLIDIASISQRVVNTLDRSVGRRTVESVRLDKIVVGSRVVLEALNKTLLFKASNADDRLMDWLNGEEPQACLRTLNQMEEMLDKKPDFGVMNFFRTSWSARTQDKGSDEAIRLFQMRKCYFHFLLTTDIWNRESGAHQDPQPSVPYTNQAPDHGQGVQSKSAGPSRGAQARRVDWKEGLDPGKLDGILGWLNPWNSRGTHERTLLLRQPDTCTWLFKTSAYKRWRIKENSVLWLHGKPGAGKSVLAASVIDDLKSTLQDGEVLAYFYCDFREERSTSTAEVLRSLLFQLLEQSRRQPVSLGDLIDDLADERDGGASTINNVTFLTRHVSRAVNQFHQPPFLVIDALDECKDTEKLLDALVKLHKSSVRLLAISRPLWIIKDIFAGLPSIDMEVMSFEISADIRLHVTRQLDSHRRLRVIQANLKNEMNSTLCKKADGMFRWVQCQINILKQCVTAAEIRETLDNLPGDLDATYGRILLEIDKYKREGKLARRALDWLVVALMPLKLSQIMDALSIDLQQRILNHDSGPVHASALLDALGSLVTYNEVTDVVILSHFSVKEYLMAESTRWTHPAYYIDKQAAHTQLALVCLHAIGIYFRHQRKLESYEGPPRDAYIQQIHRDNQNSTISHFRKRPGHQLQLFDSYPLLQYAIPAGLCHLRHVSPRNSTILRAVETFQLDAREHPLEWKQLCERADSYHFSYLTTKHDLALYILIAFAPEPLLRSFIDRSKLQLKDGSDPLIYAAYLRKVEHANTLLSRGADLNCRGWDIYDSRRLFPLEVAVERGDRAMVDLFLDNESRVPQRLFESALRDSFSKIPARIVSQLLQTDEFVEWAADQDESLLPRALDHRRYLAAYRKPSERDISVIERRLLQVGCKPPPRLDEASIRYAVSAGHVSTVKHVVSLNIPFPPDIILDASRSRNSNSTMICLALDMGCRADVISPSGNTPIHLVLMSSLLEADCLQSVHILIDAGCNPSARNLDGETALHLAAGRRLGYISVVEYLLSLQVPLPPDILLEAPRTEMLRLLLRQGADVHVIAADGNTPLHLALRDCWPPISSAEYLERAKILAHAGCSLCSPNALGKTPLHVAAEHGHLSVVQYLLSMGVPLPPSVLLSLVGSHRSVVTPVIEFLIDKGADVHATCPNGDTLLHLAMATKPETECLTRIELLVNAGCDIRVCNLCGRTPFHSAAGQAYVLVMEYLLSLGIPMPSDVMLLQFDRIPYPTPLRYCLATRFLLDRGGDVHAVTQDGDTLLHLAMKVYPEHEALELAKLLIHAGCNSSTPNSEHRLPLHVAAQKGYISGVDYFLSLYMPLPPDILLAASTSFSGKAQMIRHLIEKGADISVFTTDGDTPLHLVTTEGSQDDRLECVKMLIDAGCDPHARNMPKETPIHAAARFGSIPVLEYLLSQNVPLHDDILLTSAPSTIRFLCVTTNVDTQLLHRALAYPYEADCLECAKVLIDAGWDPSLRNSAGETPIHIAARYDHISVIQYLHSLGAPLPRDVLLVWISSGKHARMNHTLVRFLIREGACVNAAGSGRDTLLLHALCCIPPLDDDDHYAWKLVEILLDSGADPSALNVHGRTPFDIAEANGTFFKENFLRLVRNACCAVRPGS